MNIGVLTAGGVCPGVNNVVRSIVIRERNQGNKVIGFSDGFRGLNDRRSHIPLECDCGTDSLLRVSYDYVDIDKSY
jgi:6-phosphofructokinase